MSVPGLDQSRCTVVEPGGRGQVVTVLLRTQVTTSS